MFRIVRLRVLFALCGTNLVLNVTGASIPRRDGNAGPHHPDFLRPHNGNHMYFILASRPVFTMMQTDRTLAWTAEIDIQEMEMLRQEI